MKIVGVAQLAYLMVARSNIYKLVLSRLGVWKALGPGAAAAVWAEFLSSRKLQVCSQGLSTGWMRSR